MNRQKILLIQEEKLLILNEKLKRILSLDSRRHFCTWSPKHSNVCDCRGVNCKHFIFYPKKTYVNYQFIPLDTTLHHSQKCPLELSEKFRLTLYYKQKILLIQEDIFASDTTKFHLGSYSTPKRDHSYMKCPVCNFENFNKLSMTLSWIRVSSFYSRRPSIAVFE